ncbi:MAG TPA: hypothetical protein VJT09_14505 [Pyrinomonadaceae bacterium]|nr:hypothetical protein [Pyrinomonadaceae bacterium]
MKIASLSKRKAFLSLTLLTSKRRQAALTLAALLVTLLSGAEMYAQQKRVARPQKLPSAEKVVGDYLKATGGKKRQAGVKDATYEWTIQMKGEAAGTERGQQKSPASTRREMTLRDREAVSAVSSRAAWTRGLDGSLRTLTDAEARAAKLHSALTASRLVDYKKLNVQARTIAFDETLSEPAYVVEFSTKDGARLRYWFGASSKLILKTLDEARGATIIFGDYRAENGILEPHRLEMSTTGEPDATTFLLKSARYNTGLSDTLFDPPSVETLDIAKLLMEVEANQKEIDERVSDYAFTEKRIEREINDKGEVKKEKVLVFEIYPLRGGGAIYKLISENGVPISAERAAKQDKEIADYVAKHEREREKREQKEKEEAEKNKGQPAKKDTDGDDVSVAVFLRACEFVSPRRERFHDREAVVFDFRPRPGFRSKTMAESIVAKLVGVIWIDPEDKTVIRLEAKLAESFKVAGGLLASIRPGSAFTFEQTRMSDGVWLPRLAQVNFAAKIFLFKGVEANETSEFSNYRRFDTEASDYKIGAPATSTSAPPKP